MSEDEKIKDFLDNYVIREHISSNITFEREGGKPKEEKEIRELSPEDQDSHDRCNVINGYFKKIMDISRDFRMYKKEFLDFTMTPCSIRWYTAKPFLSDPVERTKAIYADADEVQGRILNLFQEAQSLASGLKNSTGIDLHCHWSKSAICVVNPEKDDENKTT